MTYPADPAELTAKLLSWYDKSHRPLPWRPKAGALGDPYHVWLSEVMLQQTTVAAVIPYFQKFLNLWPTLENLASAADEEVMAAWAGLGYYSRARNLLKCARQVVHEHNGRFPTEVSEIRKLAGCGPYTSAAIAAIAFGRPVAAIDGNVERILSRLMDDDTVLPQFKAMAQHLGQGLVAHDRPGDFVQASIELGAMICRPRNPKCTECPWGDVCLSRKAGTVAERPKRLPKTKKPKRYGLAYWVQSEDCVWLIRRPPEGLLGGMTAFPCSEWIVTEVPLSPRTPATEDWPVTVFNTPVSHVFTHFALEMTVLKIEVPNREDVSGVFGDGWWQKADTLMDAGLPTVMKKVAELVLV